MNGGEHEDGGGGTGRQRSRGQAGTGPDGAEAHAPGDAAARPAGRPPRLVMVAVGVLGGLALSEISWTGVLLAAPDLGPGGAFGPAPSSLDVAGMLVSGLLRVAMWTVLARFLWRGSATARVLTLLLALINLLSTGYGLVGPAGAARLGSWLELVWSGVDAALFLLLVGLVLTPTVRAWNTGGSLDQLAERAWTQRRAQRAALPWYQRLVRALRDDRDARR